MSSLTLPEEAARRRTFAIIAHPDAGKTTLTEHILLAGGAIRAAGAVRARGVATQRHWQSRLPLGLPVPGRHRNDKVKLSGQNAS